MKSSLFLVAAGAALAMAGPLKERKVEIVYDVVYVTKTVTEQPTLGVFFHGQRKFKVTSTSVSSTSTTPTPTPTPEAPKPQEPAPAPAPKPEPEALPIPIPKPAPAPAPKPEPAPQLAAPSGDDYVSAALYAHNIHRANHSSPAVGWSDSVAGFAAQTAAKCVFAHDLTPGGGGYGQNLAMWGSSGNPQAVATSKIVQQATTNMWYNGEINSYPFGQAGAPTPDMSNFEAWGHASQVIWAGSNQVGCASQFCPPGTMNPSMGVWFTVCNYSPPGNVGGQYGKNVLPSLGQGTITAPK